MTDYLLFGGVFLSAFVTGLFSNIAIARPNLLITYQITFISTTIGYYLFSIHLRGINNRQYFGKLSVFEAAYVTFLIGIIAQWQLMLQPETSKFFLFELPRGSSAFYPNGAGLVLSDGTIILSTAHASLAYAYWAVVSVYGAYSYWTLDLKVDSDVYQLVKKLWAISWTIFAIWAITLLPYLFIGEFMNLIVSVAYLILFVIAFNYREAVLLTHFQIIRSLQYYENNINQFYLQKVGKQTEFEEFDDVEENLTENFANIPLNIISEILDKQTDIPQAVLILSDSLMLKAIEFDKSLQHSELIGNLVSAFISFSNHTLSPQKISKSFRFLTDNSKIVISPLGNTFICYLFKGNSTSAEIRLKKFIIEQQSNLDLWNNIMIPGTKAINSDVHDIIVDLVDEAFDYELDNRQELV